MRRRFRRPSPAMVVACIALFVAVGGTALATTQPFTLGTTNRVDAASTVTNVNANGTQNAIVNPLLALNNLTTTTGATALSLKVASGHAPFTTNSATKVTNLNADRLDGLDSTSFVTTTDFRRIGPVPLAGSNIGPTVPLATIGNLTFEGSCFVDPAGNDGVQLFVVSAVDHSAYGSVTQAVAGGQFGNGDLFHGNGAVIANANPVHGQADFNPASGSAVEPDGHQVTFDLYQAINVRNQPGQCIFGGTFAAR